MKLIKSSFEILEQGPRLEGIYEAIERAGRTCYKSEAKYHYRDLETGEVFPNIPEADDYVLCTPSFEYNICTGEVKDNPKIHYLRRESITAKGFVDRMIQSLHWAMLEHGTVYLKRTGDEQISNKYHLNPYSKVNLVYPEEVLPNIYSIPTHYITTNYRVLVENGWLDDLKYLCEPTEYHEKRVTVRFTTSNSIMREFTRHRVMSFAVESTRYCNYSKDKFNNEITFIAPYWADDIDMEDIDNYPYNHEYILSGGAISLINSLFQSEQFYLKLIRDGAKPQEAREVLPLATKCDMIMTGFVSDWQHFFRLRTSIIAETGKPHPDASALAEPLMHEFENRRLI